MKQEHRGFALFIALIILMVLSIFSVSQVSKNSILTRIAANSVDAMIAFQTAEGALNQGVNQLAAGNYSVNNFVSNSNGLYLLSPTTAPAWSTINWSGSQAIQSYQGQSNTAGAYVIEQLPSVTIGGQSMARPALVYRVTARGVGASGGAPVILQALVQIPQY